MRKVGAAAGLSLLRCVFLVAMPMLGQDSQNTQEVQPPVGHSPVTVRGLVVNTATGDPVPHALVKTGDRPVLGALTDGEGRFEISGLPVGEKTFYVRKPGFRDPTVGEEGYGFAGHVVRVAEGMPEVSFPLAPDNSISGHVTLSTGAPALGIGLILVRQEFVDGRPGWKEVERHQSTPDGSFRYSGLRDGTYLVMSQPEFDNDRVVEPSCKAGAPTTIPGYSPQIYPASRELTDAIPIVLAGGQSVEVNLGLNLTEFHLVEVAVAPVPSGVGWKFSHVLLDRGGGEPDFPIHEEKDHSLCAYLPDGTYTLTIKAERDMTRVGRAALAAGAHGLALASVLEFSVEGQAGRNLRGSLGEEVVTQVHLRYEPKPPAPVKGPSSSRDGEEREDGEPLTLFATRVNSVVRDHDTAVDASLSDESTYALEMASPGAYWIHATAARQGVCLGAVTSGGQNMARTPWISGSSGGGTPIEVVLHTDCAKLTVQAPAALLANGGGEEPTLYLYAVPEFDSVEGLVERQIVPGGDHSVMFEDLMPGPYRVFALHTKRSIEFRGAAAQERFGAGQEVMLAPDGSATLILEGISK